MHAYFWGLMLDPQVFAAECHGQGINDVVIYRTLAHDLAGVVTLGLWMPTEVRFRCKAPPTRPGTLPVPRKKYVMFLDKYQQPVGREESQRKSNRMRTDFEDFEANSHSIDRKSGEI